ncbi:MAG: zinc metalloprotease HtpX, partial [Thermosynechococcaceae cyanobacterium]
MAAFPDKLRLGMDALKQGQYPQAVQTLEAFLQETDPGSKPYLQAQMHLVEAYQGNGQNDRARALCQALATSDNPQVQQWAQQVMQELPLPTPSNNPPPAPPRAAAAASPPVSAPTMPPPVPPQGVSASRKAGRAAAVGAKVALSSVAGNLALASGVTLSLLFGMVMVLCLGLLLITESSSPGIGLAIATTLALLFNAVVFFLSPFLMDLSQKWLYKTHWISLMELEHLSPESSQVLQRVCAERNLKMPRIGIIEDENPTAFTYGSLPNTARLVVSRGLFTYLDDDEVATVYAHELGHIVHWDFAVMTLAATLVQITYLIYTFANRMMRSGNSKAKS